MELEVNLEIKQILQIHLNVTRFMLYSWFLDEVARLVMAFNKTIYWTFTLRTEIEDIAVN